MAAAARLDSERFWNRRQATDSAGMDHWIQSRRADKMRSNAAVSVSALASSQFGSSTPDINKASSSSGGGAGGKARDGEITLSELSRYA